MAEWISVKDRLPEIWVKVLSFQPTFDEDCCGMIRGAVYIGNGKWRETEHHEMMELPVTHWLPLPEPPKEGGGEADKKTNCSDCVNRYTPVCKYCEHDAEGGGEDG